MKHRALYRQDYVAASSNNKPVVQLKKDREEDKNQKIFK